MKNLESLKQQAREILAKEPIWSTAFPPEPWDEDALEEIAVTVEAFLIVDSVIDEDPWVDWLDRWKFYKASK